MLDEKKQGNTDQIDVGYVAHLARLYLNKEETVTFQNQLSGIVDYVRQIGALDLSGIEPTSHARPVLNVLREDKVIPGLEHDVVMDNAPLEKDGQFCVPRIME